MAYTHHQIETRVGSGVDISAGNGASFRPGYVPMLVRAVAVAITSGPTTTSAETITVKARGETVATLEIPSGADVGKVYYADGLEEKVSPGEALEFESAGDSGAGEADLLVFHQPVWEHPDNNDDLIDAKQ